VGAASPPPPSPPHRELFKLFSFLQATAECADVREALHQWSSRTYKGPKGLTPRPLASPAHDLALEDASGSDSDSRPPSPQVAEEFYSTPSKGVNSPRPQAAPLSASGKAAGSAQNLRKAASSSAMGRTPVGQSPLSSRVR
jgi:hypothetical protein